MNLASFPQGRHRTHIYNPTGFAISSPTKFTGTPVSWHSARQASKKSTGKWAWVKRNAFHLFFAAFAFSHLIPAFPQKTKAMVASVLFQEAPQWQSEQEKLLQEFQNQYGKTGDRRIDWFELADILDTIAQRTDSDESFRRMTGVILPALFPLLDKENTGLPASLHNVDSEGTLLYTWTQVLHMLGFAFGFSINGEPTLSQYYGEPDIYWMFETFEAGMRRISGKDYRFTLNMGDIRLSEQGRLLRNTFFEKGRMSVGEALREMLRTQP